MQFIHKINIGPIECSIRYKTAKMYTAMAVKTSSKCLIAYVYLNSVTLSKYNGIESK